MEEQKVKNDSFFQISGFMVNELKLKGTELYVFAIIHTITKCGGIFYGSRQYLADFTASKIRSVQYALNNLVAKNLLEKSTRIEKSGKVCTYKSRYNEDMQKLHTGNAFFAQPSAKFAHNNKENNLNKNIITNNNIAPLNIELKSYLLSQFSNVTKDMWFTDLSINLVNNRLDFMVNEYTYKVMTESSNDWEMLLQRQLEFYNLQFKTDYILNIMPKVIAL